MGDYDTVADDRAEIGRLNVTGRLRRPVVTVATQEAYPAPGALPAGLKVRVDDEANPEFWLEVFVTEDTLAGLGYVRS